MTVDEFLRWMAYFSLEPFGEKRQDYRFAMLMSLHANMWRKKGKPRLSVKRFLPRFLQKKEKSMKELEFALQAQFSAMGGVLPETKDR